MTKKTLQIVVALIFVVVAGSLLYAERSLPRAGPATAVRFHTESLARGNLADLRTSATPAVYLRYQTQASRPAFEEAEALFNDRIPDVARPVWRAIRKRARAAAGKEYEELRRKVPSLGQTHYRQLGADERRRIVESGTFKQVVFEAGVEALPDEERSRVPDATAFFKRADRGSYLDRESWRHLPEEQKTELGSPRALSEEETLEKLKYFDKTAAPNLTDRESEIFAAVERADVQSLDRFVSVHGERLLAERLTENPPRLAGTDRLDCSSPAFDRGSLLHGPIATCVTEASTPSFTLTRVPFGWLVSDVSGLAMEPGV